MVHGLDWHNNTPGVQHLALRTDDELHSIAALRSRGVDFLSIPDTYYEQVWKRIEPLLAQAGKSVKEDHQKVKDLGILVDADEEGYLLQLFTKPLQDRPTLFFEIICRRGSQAFGKGNFKALFEALGTGAGEAGESVVGRRLALLFENAEAVRRTLDVQGVLAVTVVDEMLEMWNTFEPFADRVFVQETRRATHLLDQYQEPGDDRRRAYEDFQRRYWEMHLGCSLIVRGLSLVKGADRPEAGPDHLVLKDGIKIWVECIAPGPGTGADRVPDFAEAGGCHDVPDTGIKLRLLSAIKEKRGKWSRYVERSHVNASDAFVIAINGRLIPSAFLDDEPPRIARILYGAGNLAVKFNLQTNSVSEPYLVPQSSIVNANGVPISTNGFLTDEMANVSAVLYSNDDAWNSGGGGTGSFVSVLNPRANITVPNGWFSNCRQYTWRETSAGGQVDRSEL